MLYEYDEPLVVLHRAVREFANAVAREVVGEEIGFSTLHGMLEDSRKNESFDNFADIVPSGDKFIKRILDNLIVPFGIIFKHFRYSLMNSVSYLADQKKRKLKEADEQISKDGGQLRP